MKVIYSVTLPLINLDNCLRNTSFVFNECPDVITMTLLYWNFKECRFRMSLGSRKHACILGYRTSM